MENKAKVSKHKRVKNAAACNTNIVSATKEVLPRGKTKIVDLLVLTSLDQLLFISKMLLTFFRNLATLFRR
jgi:hypothetical protein